jgi:hypothetical protein
VQNGVFTSNLSSRHDLWSMDLAENRSTVDLSPRQQRSSPTFWVRLAPAAGARRGDSGRGRRDRRFHFGPH